MESISKLNRILVDEKPSDFILANEPYMFNLIPELKSSWDIFPNLSSRSRLCFKNGSFIP